MAGIYKAYDIRGIYGKEFDENTAYKIGRAIVQFLDVKNVVVGYDMRVSTPKLFEKLAQGIIDQGADVIDIGLVSSPINYFANWSLEADSSVMITASHNPAEYNGFKIAVKGAQTLSNQTGLLELQNLVEKNEFIQATNKGRIIKKEIVKEYFDHMLKYAKKSNLKIVSDYANAMGIVEGEALKSIATIIPMYETLDGTLPNHEANPAKSELFSNLSEKVRDENADFGIMFDGDADRVGFVDENGACISPDMIIALIGRYLIQKNITKSVVYDLRSSNALNEIFSEIGGNGFKVRVGNPFIKIAMRENDASFGGELAGHFMFKENSYGESTLLTVIYIINIIIESKKKLSELVKEVHRYPRTNEINLEVEDKKRVLENLEVFYYQGKPGHIDGLTMNFDNWWFSVRVSNTEPVIRINIEANDEKILNEKKYELLDVIQRIIEHKI